MYTIGPARVEELACLPEIERRASKLFLAFPFTADLPADPSPLSEFETAERQGLLWVARLQTPGVTLDEPVGFAMVEDFGPHLHLEEVDVVPEHGRQGLGTRLVREVLKFAEVRRRPVTLSTFGDIPWNAPFYARLGFRELPGDDWSPALADRMREEAARGLTPDLRVAMQFDARHTHSP
jgi:GNAT superfamily N-acetyltransferase